MLTYERKGEGRPVVLLQGPAVGPGSWGPLFERLAERFQTVVFELQSGSPAALSAELKVALEQLRVERPLLVGRGAGATLACLLSSHRVPRGVIAVELPFDSGLPAILETFEAPLLCLHRGDLSPADKKSLTTAHPESVVESWPDLGRDVGVLEAERFVVRLAQFDTPLLA